MQRWPLFVKNDDMVTRIGTLCEWAGGGAKIDHAQIHTYCTHEWASGAMHAYLGFSSGCTRISIAVANSNGGYTGITRGRPLGTVRHRLALWYSVYMQDTR